MNPKLLTKISPILLTSLALVGLLLAGLAASAPAPVYAAESTLTPPDPAKLDKVLTSRFLHLQNQQAIEVLRLEEADRLIGDVEDWLADLKAAGKDTTKLETALAAARAQQAEAEAAQAQATAILAEHAGFAADGQVTDREMARETLAQARAALNETQYILREARQDFMHVVREWRREQRGSRLPQGAGGK